MLTYTHFTGGSQVTWSSIISYAPGLLSTGKVNFSEAMGAIQTRLGANNSSAHMHSFAGYGAHGIWGIAVSSAVPTLLCAN